jgi:hypothetical protein
VKVKLKIKRPQNVTHSEDKDIGKLHRIRLKLTKVSEQNRAETHKRTRLLLKARGIKRDTLAPNHPSRPDYDPTLNKQGDARGIATRDNPKDSAYYKRIRGMRKFYNKQMPQLQCNSCSFAQSCPQMKAGYECAFLPFLNSHKVETMDDLLEYAKELTGANMRRSHLLLIMETLSGAQPSLEVAESLNLSFTQLMALHKMMGENSESSFELETDDQGIISQIFGGLSNLRNDTVNAHEKPIDIQAQVVEKSEITADSHNLQYALPGSGSDINHDLLNEFEALTGPKHPQEEKPVQITTISAKKG